MRCWVPLSSLTSWYPGYAPHLHWSPTLPILGPISCRHLVQQESAQVPASLVAALRLERKQRILWMTEGYRPGRGSAGFNSQPMLLGKCSTTPGAKQGQQMVRAQRSSFGNTWLRVLQPKLCDTQPCSADWGTPSLLSKRQTAFLRCPGYSVPVAQLLCSRLLRDL